MQATSKPKTNGLPSGLLISGLHGNTNQTTQTSTKVRVGRRTHRADLQVPERVTGKPARLYKGHGKPFRAAKGLVEEGNNTTKCGGIATIIPFRTTPKFALKLGYDIARQACIARPNGPNTVEHTP